MLKCILLAIALNQSIIHKDKLYAQSDLVKGVCKELGCDDLDMAIIIELERILAKRRLKAGLPLCPIDPFMWRNLSCA